MQEKLFILKQKLNEIDELISEKELFVLREDFERELKLEQNRKSPNKKKVLRLFGMIDFLGAWMIIKGDR